MNQVQQINCRIEFQTIIEFVRFIVSPMQGVIRLTQVKSEGVM